MASTRMSASSERVCILDQFIRTLDEFDRHVLLMYLDRCTYQQISEVTSFAESAVRARLGRLGKQLSEYAGKSNTDLDLDEQLITEWHNQPFEGYLFETPADQILEDTRKRAEARDRQYRLGNHAHLALLFVVAAATAIGLYEVRAVGGRIALLVVMPAVFCELLLRLKWRAEEHNQRFVIGMKTVVLEERARILTRIRQTRWQVAWYAVTGIAGAVYLLLPATPSLGDTLDFISGLLSAVLLAHFVVLIKRLIGLRPEIIGVEHDLKKFETFGRSMGSGLECRMT